MRSVFANAEHTWYALLYIRLFFRWTKCILFSVLHQCFCNVFYIVERANAILMIWREYHILAYFAREPAAIIYGAKSSTCEISIASFDKKMIYVQRILIIIPFASFLELTETDDALRNCEMRMRSKLPTNSHDCTILFECILRSVINSTAAGLFSY